MARRQWTLMVIAEGTAATRQVRLSREIVQIGIAAVLLLVAGFSSVVTGLVVRDSANQADERLVARNLELQSELTTVTSHIDTLRSSLDSLYQQDEKYRLIAGLTPMDAAVQQVGVGGPGGASDEAGMLSDVSALIRRARLLSFSWGETSDTLEERYDRLESMPSITPTKGYITSGFTRARMHPLLRYARPHTGVDIVANVGTPIVAAAKGRVRFVGRNKDYGLSVEIDHGYGIVTRYAHTSATLVKVGQQVERGDTIARVGQTGLAVGPHLHYEVIVHGKQTDPARYLLDLSVVPE
jgi:murein DD-endopeptidase MepM/ murein hydrolase activator NlpD